MTLQAARSLSSARSIISGAASCSHKVGGASVPHKLLACQG